MIARMLVALALSVLIAGPAFAGPGSSATYKRRLGVVDVNIAYTAPTSCHMFSSIRKGPPGGISVPNNTIAVTVVVARSGGNCGGSKVLRDVTVLIPDLQTLLVKVFFVNPAGKRLKTEQIPVFGL